MRVATSVWSALVLVVLAQPAAAQRADKPSDPVDAVRRALAEPIKNPSNFEEIEFRRRSVLEKIDGLRTIAQMGNALAMPEGWLDNPIDQELRAELADRLYHRLRRILETGSTEQQLAALTLIGSLGRVRGAAKSGSILDVQTAIVGEMIGDRLGILYLSTGAWLPPNRGRIARPLAPDVMAMLDSKVLPVRITAARTLGQINPDPRLAAPALQKVIDSAAPAELRQAAARALVDLAHHATEAYANRLASGAAEAAIARVEVGNSLAAQEFLREDLLDMIPAVVLAARSGMDDPDDQIELSASEAVTIAARALGVLVPDPLLRRDFPAVGRPWTEAERRLIDDYARVVAGERQELLPAAEALAKLAVKQPGHRVTPIVNVLRDEDAPVRLQACTALQEISYARWKLIQRQASVPPYDKTTLPADEDPLKAALLDTLPALEQQMSDQDQAIRLMAVKAIEWLQKEAAPATPTLVRGLRDANRFVRWQSARILGDIKPAPEAVPMLAALLADQDLDLRLVAAETLAEYGATAKAALPALQAAVNRGDPEIRLAAIDAIVKQGKQAESSIPALIQALDASDPRVVSAAASALNSFGAAARVAEPALRRLLDHPDPAVRRAISESLLDLMNER